MFELTGGCEVCDRRSNVGEFLSHAQTEKHAMIASIWAAFLIQIASHYAF